MFKKPLIHFFSLLLLITFTQISLTEESEKSEESDKKVVAALAAVVAPTRANKVKANVFNVFIKKLPL